MAINPAVFSSKSDEWATPQDLFDTLHAEYHFTLDACATRENAKLPVYYSKEEDGLTRSWSRQRVWINPPYTKGQIKRWLAKARQALDSEGCKLVVFLVPARTDTAWFHDYVYKKPHVEVQFIRGRLKFGKSRNSAPFPSMLVIMRP